MCKVIGVSASGYFEVDQPNKKWVTNITYLPTAAGFVYLAVVLDLLSRKVVGWTLSESLATPLVSKPQDFQYQARTRRRSHLSKFVKTLFRCSNAK